MDDDQIRPGFCPDYAPVKANAVATSNNTITTYVNTLSSEDTIAPDGVGPVQQVTLDSDRSRAPGSPPPKGMPRRAERVAQTKTTLEVRERTTTTLRHSTGGTNVWVIIRHERRRA